MDDGRDGGDGTGARAPRRCASLAQRRLLWSGAVAPGEGADASRRRRRTARPGVVLGLAAGDAGRAGTGRRRDADVRAGGRGVARPRLAGARRRSPSSCPGSWTRCGCAVRRSPAAVDGPPGRCRRGTSRRVDVVRQRRAGPGGCRRRGVRRRSVVDRRARRRSTAAVTHADRRATAASAALAAIDRRADPTRSGDRRRVDVCRAVVGVVRRAGRRASCSSGRWRRCGDGGDVRRSRRWGVRASDTLALAVWCALVDRRPGRRRSPRRGPCEHGSHDGRRHHRRHRRSDPRRSCAARARGAATSRARAAYPELARRHRPTPTVDRRRRRRLADIWFLLDRSRLDAVDRPRRRRRVRPVLRRASAQPAARRP